MPAGPPVHDAFFPGVKRRAWPGADVRGSAGPVIVILVDALQAAHLSTYGYERPTAPAVDRLANEGVLFTQAIAASCWTRPTIATVMTGKPLAEHRMEDAGARLDPSYVTLAEAFHAAGRPTAAFVANPIVRSLYGYDQGFDTYMDSDDLGRRTPAIGVLEPATAWVREHARDDFLLWVFLTDPHDPYQPNAATAGMFTEEPGEFPVQPPPQVARPFPAPVQARIIAAYDESIRYASDEIVTFFDELRRLGVYDRATIVFSADHGEMLGEHGSWRHLYQLWEPAIRIPLVIRSPAIPAALRGTAETRLVAQTSLMPTLLELSGLSSPEGVRGRSILPMLGDRAGR